MDVNSTEVLEATAAKIEADFTENTKTIDYSVLRENINKKNDFGRTLLHNAAEFGKLEAATVLINNGADINCLDNNGNTCLHRAAIGGHVDTIRYFLQHSNVNVKNSLGRTPLQNAAEFGQLPAVRFLVDNEADLACLDSCGNTCLHRAAIGGHVDTIRYFLQHSNVNVKNSLGRTPLQNAAEFGQLPAVRFLVDNEADLACLDSCGNTCLHRAAIGGHVDTIRYFLQHSNVNVKNSLGRTPLQNAAEFGQLPAVKFLVDNEADLACLDSCGNTCLHRATIGGNINTIEYFLRNSNVNVKNSSGRTPLHIAAEFGTLEAAKLLIEKGAELDCMDNNGNFCLHRAACGGHLNTIEYFLYNDDTDVDVENTLGRTPLHNAAEFGRFDAVKFLIDNKAYPLCKDDNGNTALHRAAIGADIKTIEYLLEIFLDNSYEINLKNTAGRTPLHLAAEFGNLEAAKFLTGEGADPTCVDNFGNTCLHRAAIGGNINTIEYFLQHNSVDARNNLQGTSLHFAKEHGNEDAAKFLIGQGADPEHYSRRTNSNGPIRGLLNNTEHFLRDGHGNGFRKSFLQYAMFFGKFETIVFLLILLILTIVILIYVLLFN